MYIRVKTKIVTKIKLLFLCLSFVCIQKTYGQAITFYSEFEHILDNREYFTKYGFPQTILGARLNLIAGIELDSLNSIKGGINYMYEYGANINEVPSQLNLFYRHKSKKISAYFGSFPRKKLLKYPLALLKDTLNYYKPNIDGAFFKFSNRLLNVGIWSDWMSRQTQTRREAFMAGIFGDFKYRRLYLDYFAYMYHLAGDATKSQDIRDNGAGAVFLGIDLTFLNRRFKKFSADIGIINSYNRVRPNPYVNYSGFMSRLKMHFKKFGTNATLYFGDSQNLAFGDPLYKAKRYHRVDLFVIPYKTANISTRFSLNFHLVNGDLNSSQQLSVIAHFNTKKPIKLFNN